MSPCNVEPTSKIEFNDVPFKVWHEVLKATCCSVIVLEGLITAQMKPNDCGRSLSTTVNVFELSIERIMAVI